MEALIKVCADIKRRNKKAPHIDLLLYWDPFHEKRRKTWTHGDGKGPYTLPSTPFCAYGLLVCESQPICGCSKSWFTLWLPHLFLGLICYMT